MEGSMEHLGQRIERVSRPQPAYREVRHSGGRTEVDLVRLQQGGPKESA
jgi:hypothetical protein